MQAAAQNYKICWRCSLLMHLPGSSGRCRWGLELKKINPTKIPRCGKSTVLHRKFSSIASGLCARARGRWELAKIFDFMNTTYSISRWIDAFFIFSEKTRTSHFADHIFINPKNFSVNLRIVERIFYKFTMHTARRPANHQGKKMSGFRGRRRAVGPIYNNGYTTQ